MRVLLFVLLLTLIIGTVAAASDAGFVKAKDGSFYLNGAVWHPFGAMYTPLYSQAGVGKESKDWIADYDPKAVDDDLDLMQSLGFNALRILDSVYYNNNHRNESWVTYPTPETSYKTRFNDFLDKLGKRGMKAQIFFHYTPEGSRWIPSIFDFISNKAIRDQSLGLIQKTIKELGLASRPEVWSYEVDWEPTIGGDALRNSKQALVLWNQWIEDHYGSAENARKSWGYIGEVKEIGGTHYVSAPTDDQMLSDGEWTKKSVAYRRFVIELINKKYAYLTKAIRDVDPNHLVTGQRVVFVSRIPFTDTKILYPIRHTCTYQDYIGYTFSPHDTWGLYDINEYQNNPDRFRKQAFAIRYSKSNKPVIYDEFGATTYYEKPEHPEEHFEQVQKIHYRRMLEVGKEFGIDGVLAWWWQGKRPMDKNDGEISDWGIRRMNGTLKPCSEVLKEQSPLIKSIPEYKPDMTLVADEWAHANEADMYIQGKQEFLTALQQGKRPDVVTQYEGTTSANCPLTRLDGSENSFGPVRAFNSSLGVIEIETTPNNWDTAQYGDLIKVGHDEVAIKLQPGNTGDALWLSKPENGKGNVVLVVKSGQLETEYAIPADIKPDTFIKMRVTVLVGETKIFMRSKGRADFGEVFKLRLLR